MKREIKFRSLYNGVWYYQTLDEMLPITIAAFRMGEHKTQFTGLMDKNGREIYEGDKCNCRMIGDVTHIEEVVTEVIYDLTVGAFGHRVISTGSNYTFFGLNSKNLLSCEVIGNIFENKDLLLK